MLCVQFKVSGITTLINFGSGTCEDRAVVVDAGAVPKLIKILSTTETHQVVWNCIRCLTTLTVDIKYRDTVLEAGIIPQLIHWAEHFLNKNLEITELRSLNEEQLFHIVLLFCSLCNSSEGVDAVQFSVIRDFLPILSRILNESCWNYQDAFIWACKAIFELTCGSLNHERIQAVIESGVCPRLVQLLYFPNPDVANAALDALINLSAGNVEQKEMIVEVCGLFSKDGLPWCETLEKFYALIGNIACGGAVQIQRIVDAYVISRLVRTAKVGKAKEMLYAARAIYNMACAGSLEQVGYLVKEGALEALCHQLNLATDVEILSQKLDALDPILERERTKERSGWVKRVEQCGGKLG